MAWPGKFQLGHYRLAPDLNICVDSRQSCKTISPKLEDRRRGPMFRLAGYFAAGLVVQSRPPVICERSVRLHKGGAMDRWRIHKRQYWDLFALFRARTVHQRYAGKFRAERRLVMDNWLRKQRLPSDSRRDISHRRDFQRRKIKSICSAPHSNLKSFMPPFRAPQF